jgi:E3 ubiquitin-protein ligase HUWE1
MHLTIAEQEVASNQTFRNLVTLHIRVTLLSDVFATAGYAHGRSAISLLQTFMSNTTPQVVKDLGSLHRATVWENIVLKAGLVSKGIDIAATPSSSPLEATPEQATIPLPDPEVATIGGTNGVQPETNSTPTPSPEDPKQGSSRHHNATALKHLTHGLPSSLAPFFQGIDQIRLIRGDHPDFWHSDGEDVPRQTQSGGYPEKANCRLLVRHSRNHGEASQVEGVQ